MTITQIETLSKTMRGFYDPAFMRFRRLQDHVAGVRLARKSAEVTFIRFEKGKVR